MEMNRPHLPELMTFYHNETQEPTKKQTDIFFWDTLYIKVMLVMVTELSDHMSNVEHCFFSQKFSKYFTVAS